MRYRVTIHPDAEKELRDAHAWLTAQSPLAAARWRKGLLEKVQTLGRFPERCPLAPEARKLGEEVRQLLHGRHSSARYRLLFVVEQGTVTVLHIVHGKRRLVAEDE